MPEEMTQTAVTTAASSVSAETEGFSDSMTDEEAISEVAARAVSEAMENVGVTSVQESEAVSDSEMMLTETEAVVTEVATFPNTIVETESEITEKATEAENTAVLLPEEAEIVTESVTEVTGVTEAVPKVLIEPQQVIGPLLIIGLGAAALVMKKFGGKKKVTDHKSAKARDAARLEAAKSSKSKKQSKSDKSEKEKKNLSKRVLETIPYKKILADNIWFLGKKMYSKAYTFDDINFNLADEEQQYMYLERYIEFMNVLDDTVDCQICLWNSKINIEEFRHRTLMKQRADDFFNLRFEYNNRVLEENIKKGQNAIQKHMYITLTIKAPDEETAARKFKSLDIAAINSFNRIGNTNMRELTSQERVEMLKDFYIGTDEDPVPTLTSEDYAKGREKLYCAPDYFDFKKDYFMFNDTYAKTIFIREYPATATSEIFTDLLATGIEIMITTNIETYDTAAARKLVQHQITALDTDMAKREVAAAQHGNFSSQMPQRIKNQRDSMVSVFDKITTKDQKLFLTNIQILIKANAALISAEKAKAAAMKNADAETNIRDNVIPGLEMAGEYISAIKNGDAVGMITQPAVSVIKNNMGSLSGISDGISTISGAVQSSDSVGDAAVNVGTSLAANRMKNAVTNALFKPSDEKIAERLEKKLRYIDRISDKEMSRIQKEKAEAMNGSINKNLEKKLDKIERNQEKYKQKLERQRKDLQRKQQKNIYIQHNRKNPAFVGNKLKKKVGGAGGKSKLLLLGSGASVMFVILVIIIFLILITSFFSWLTPYDYSLAGDDSGGQTEAKTEVEIIDGYANLIQNYMDVTQAYYYLVYGDWYGGVYDYPAPDISFSDYLAQYQSKLISDIQAKYSAAFANAKTPEEVSAISRAMSAEISAALQASVSQARIEYDALMKALDDSMKAKERRQHYEVYNGGGGNGVKDSEEFTGMPIVGTNHFGNVEIKSDLSAEELLAMTALYKSLKVIGSEDEADADAEVVYNITTDDIMEFFKETEFIPITTEITHDHPCDGTCRRRLIGDYESGYSWEYYCNNDHDQLTGEIGSCKTKDELIEKIFELTNAGKN